MDIKTNSRSYGGENPKRARVPRDVEGVANRGFDSGQIVLSSVFHTHHRFTAHPIPATVNTSFFIIVFQFYQ